MPKLEVEAIEQTNRTGYPMPYAAEMGGRHYRRIGAAGGLTQLGVSHVVLEGEAVLVEDAGETLLRAGDCAAFPKDVPNGHRLINRSDRPCLFLAVDCRIGEGDCHYPDVDLHAPAGSDGYTRKDGTPY